MKYLVGIAAALLLVCALGLFFFFRGARPLHPPTADGAAASSSPLTGTDREPPAGWRVYSNPRYRFSLYIPAAMKVGEFDERGGAFTVTFENALDAQGLQIFIVPYSGSQVTDARFREDEPSGVRNDLASITIDGVTAASFYSTDSTLGDTREIWFINNGYLYEITTLKSLEPLLDTIMQSWKFI